MDEREKHSDKTLTELYHPDKMSIPLIKKHQEMDFAVEQCYSSKPFSSDEHRLEYLFQTYEGMMEKERLV